MRKSRYTEEQIIGFIKQAESGLPIKDLCCKGGFRDATFYKWRAKYGRMDVPDARRLRELEAESKKLKKLLAEAHLDIHALNTAFGLRGKAIAPQAKRAAVAIMIGECGLSERRACRLVGFSRDSYRNPPEADAMTQELSSKIVEIAHAQSGGAQVQEDQTASPTKAFRCNWPRRSMRCGAWTSSATA